jgi:hypothetical protein
VIPEIAKYTGQVSGFHGNYMRKYGIYCSNVVFTTHYPERFMHWQTQRHMQEIKTMSARFFYHFVKAVEGLGAI